MPMGHAPLVAWVDRAELTGSSKALPGVLSARDVDSHAAGPADGLIARVVRARALRGCKAHELRNEVVAELKLIGGAKGAENWPPSPREMAETGGQRGKKAEESKD